MDVVTVVLVHFNIIVNWFLLQWENGNGNRGWKWKHPSVSMHTSNFNAPRGNKLKCNNLE